MSHESTSNPDTLRSAYADDPEMAELVTFFVEAMGERIADLHAALEAGDLHRLQRLAHQLKGAAKGYGFATITDCAAELDTLLKGDPVGTDLDVLTASADRLIAMCLRVSS